MNGNPEFRYNQHRERQFDSTHWSIVLAATGASTKTAENALSELCQSYWPPLYAYALRKTGDVHQAQDLTQAFFAHLLDKKSIQRASPDRGRFRSFLLSSLQNFMHNQWRATQAQKRGGDRQIFGVDFESQHPSSTVDNETPEKVFEKAWAVRVIGLVLNRLQSNWETRGKTLEFSVLKAFLTGKNSKTSYAQAAKELGMTESAAKTAASRLRSEYRKQMRAEIAQTVENPDDVEDEIRQLFRVFSQP